MKKLLTLVLFQILMVLAFAGNLIQISLQDKHEIKVYQANPDIQIHYACDEFLIASANESFAGEFVLIDKNCWWKGQTYYIAWFHKAADQEYIQQMSANTQVLLKGDLYLIMAASEADNIYPPVDGRLTKISSKAIKQPTKSFTYTKGMLLVDPDIEAMIEEVDTNIYVTNLQHLQDYGTRNAYTPQSVEAQNWIKAQYEGLGYSVELFDFSMPNGPASDNVIATKIGTKYPDEYVVIGGHYDSYSYSGDAPGADDDGSGTCGVMEVARVMADFETDRTVLFCAWSGEEYGLYGSEAYADWAASQGMNILGYFNIDMCGYRNPGDPIHTDMIAPSSAQPLIDFYTDVCGMYLPDFIIDAGALSGGDSDHTSFNNAGYMGIFPFEDSQNYSPYIHTSNDVIGTSVNSLEMAMMFTQAMVANVATMANWLAPPQNLVGIAGDATIELMWDPVLEIDQYNIYRNNDPVAIANTTEPYYMDEDVENFTTYTYYVTAIYTSTGEESNPSNVITITPLPAMAFPFIDDFENGAMYWSFEGTWGLSTSQSYSPTHAITESPSGNYNNNLEISATLFNFGLETAISAELSFMTKYALESNYDYTWLELSTNGNNWIELDEFNGNQSSWTEKVYDLNEYLGEPLVLIRFRFYSDTYVTEDGMYIDDLELNVEEMSTSGINPDVTYDGQVSIHPNPFNATSAITVKSLKSTEIEINIYNSLGEKVWIRSDMLVANETSTFTFDASGLPSGVYYCDIKYDGKSTKRKMILTK
ncbi:MAG: M28 family peptidase [Bacteroidales bacterium]|nr:M28 family peptidase [Bacteroidales bacterium]MCF8405231.1 M28 family peptidase [Bacteroidales bacterium]